VATSKRGRMAPTSRVCITAVFLAAAGCARSTSGSPAEGTAATPSRSADVITASELADPAISGGDVYVAVSRLRPRFLMTRGTGSVQDTTAGRVHVSVNAAPLQGVEVLSHT